MPQSDSYARARGWKNAAVVIANKAREAYSDLAPIMQEWHKAGLSQQVIADKLNA